MRNLSYFYRVDREGFPVPGSLQRFKEKPMNGRWKQLEYDNICCAPDDNEIDVFLIAGQSNAVGQAKDVPTPTITGNSILQVNNGVISPANDPVGIGSNKANIYSAWPQFGLTYTQLTNRKVAFVPAAKAGTGQQANTDTGGGNWSPTGTLYNASVVKLNSALDTLSTHGYIPTFKGIIWYQGENDAIGINNSTATQAGYIAGFQQMVANYRALYGSNMKLYMIRIGTRTTDDAGMQSIREAQEQIVAADPNTIMIYRGTVEFYARGLMSAEPYHFKTAGYNEIGRIGALEVVNSQ
jgi:hypothetical protein